MNAREKILLVSLIVILGGGAAIFGGKRWWWDPLQAYNAKIDTLNDEVTKAQTDVLHFQMGQKKLAQARLKSLPAKPEQAAPEYQLQYLMPLLIDSGLTVETTQQGTTSKNIKPVTPITGVTYVEHQIMNFRVLAHGELSNLVTALENMQKTPYEHRVTKLHVYRSEAGGTKENPELKIEMEIEVLLVAGTKNTPGTPLRTDLATPPPENRSYAKIANRDIFVGPLGPIVVYKEGPKPPDVVVTEDDGPKGPVEPDESTPAYIFLTHTSPDEQIAYLRNRVYAPVGSQEMKLNARRGSGYDTFKVTDEGGSFVFFRALLLRVEQRQIFIQIRDAVYTVAIGKSLADMNVYGFGESTYDLEDRGLFDRAFFKEEVEREKQEELAKQGKKDNKGKTPTKKGR